MSFEGLVSETKEQRGMLDLKGGIGQGRFRQRAGAGTARWSFSCGAGPRPWASSHPRLLSRKADWEVGQLALQAQLMFPERGMCLGKSTAPRFLVSLDLGGHQAPVSFPLGWVRFLWQRCVLPPVLVRGYCMLLLPPQSSSSSSVVFTPAFFLSSEMTAAPRGHFLEPGHGITAFLRVASEMFFLRSLLFQENQCPCL